MTLPVPNLDDRQFADLVREARETASRLSPEWTDMSVHDPGMTLVEVFAHLTEVMLYRLNRLPEKAYVEFLNLLGLTRHPPSAAWTTVTFTRTGGGDTSRRSPSRPAPGSSPPGGPSGRWSSSPWSRRPSRPARHRDRHRRVPLRGGRRRAARRGHRRAGSGAAGQPGADRHRAERSTSCSAWRPIRRRCRRGRRPVSTTAARSRSGVRRATSPAAGPGAKVYLLDRGSGTVTFAPAIDGPPATWPGRSRWRRCRRPAGRSGSGTAPVAGRTGNVAAGTLTSLRDAVPGVTVTNPEPARAAGTWSRWRRRWPAGRTSCSAHAPGRDRARLRGAGHLGPGRRWPGPGVHPGLHVVVRPAGRGRGGAGAPRGRAGPAGVAAAGGDAGRAPGRRRPAPHAGGPGRAGGRSAPLSSPPGPGTRRSRCGPGWWCGPRRTADAVRRRIHDRLHQTISPLPTRSTRPAGPSASRCGRPMCTAMLEHAEPGVRYVERRAFRGRGRTRPAGPRRRRRRVPDTTWYAGCARPLFRSTNGGVSWELVDASRARVPRVCRHRRPPGRAWWPAPARSSWSPGPPRRLGRAPVRRPGQTLVTKLAEMEPAVADVAWIDRDDAAALLLATDTGPLRAVGAAGTVPLQVLVDPSDADRGFYAVPLLRLRTRGAPGWR